VWNLHTAPASVGRPKVEQKDFAPKLNEAVNLAIDVTELKVRHSFALQRFQIFGLSH
jgi:hypothetical protein